MTRNDIFRRRLGRQINVRHDHDVGRCVGFDIIMQQIFTRLCCEDAADKTVILLNLSCMRLENTSLSSTHGGSARSHVRDTVNGRPCRLQHADAPINSIRQLSMMTWRKHDPRKESNARSCCRDKAWFSSTPPAHVGHQCACSSCQF